MEVKYLKELWKVNEYVENKPAYQRSAQTIESLLKILELKFDEDEEAQEKK